MNIEDLEEALALPIPEKMTLENLLIGDYFEFHKDEYNQSTCGFETCLSEFRYKGIWTVKQIKLNSFLCLRDFDGYQISFSKKRFVKKVIL